MLNTMLLRQLNKHKTRIGESVKELTDIRYKIDTCKNADSTNDCILEALELLKLAKQKLDLAVKHCPPTNYKK